MLEHEPGSQQGRDQRHEPDDEGECGGDRDCVPGQLCASGACAEPDELIDGRLIPDTSTGPEMRAMLRRLMSTSSAWCKDAQGCGQSNG